MGRLSQQNIKKKTKRDESRRLLTYLCQVELAFNSLNYIFINNQLFMKKKTFVWQNCIHSLMDVAHFLLCLREVFLAQVVIEPVCSWREPPSLKNVKKSL
jgi:hypothetical protein